MKFKQVSGLKDKVNKKIKENGWNVSIGMAWVKVWLRWKKDKNRLREQKVNYKKEEKKEEKEYV